MTRIEILARFQRGSLTFPPKLRNMVSRYIEAINEGPHTPSKLLRNGQRLLNATFIRADEGCQETQATMIRDGINAMTLATAAELFGTAAAEFEAQPADTAQATSDHKDALEK